MPGFHVGNGWTFERTGKDGQVAIRWKGPRSKIELFIDASTWASAVASVTPQGDNAETFQIAEMLHSGELSKVAPFTEGRKL